MLGRLSGWRRTAAIAALTVVAGALLLGLFVYSGAYHQLIGHRFNTDQTTLEIERWQGPGNATELDPDHVRENAPVLADELDRMIAEGLESILIKDDSEEERICAYLSAVLDECQEPFTYRGEGFVVSRNVQ